MLGLELVEDASHGSLPPARTRRVLDFARERGLLLLRAGTHDNVIRLLAPLVATDEDLERGVEILAGALATPSATTPERPDPRLRQPRSRWRRPLSAARGEGSDGTALSSAQ